MVERDSKGVEESSIFFQGHIDQLFSKNKLSYQITTIFEDQDSLNIVQRREVQSDSYGADE